MMELAIASLVIGLSAGLILGWAITLWSCEDEIRVAMRTADRFGFRRGLSAGREDERKCWETKDGANGYRG
jgi:hypothetical protein